MVFFPSFVYLIAGHTWAASEHSLIMTVSPSGYFLIVFWADAPFKKAMVSSFLFTFLFKPRLDVRHAALKKD